MIEDKRQIIEMMKIIISNENFDKKSFIKLTEQLGKISIISSLEFKGIFEGIKEKKLRNILQELILENCGSADYVVGLLYKYIIIDFMPLVSLDKSNMYA